MKTIQNKELKENLNPKQNAAFESIRNFALTFNKDEYRGFLEIPSPESEYNTLTTYRVHLIAFQGRYTGYLPNAEQLDKAKKVVEKIREKVINQEFE